MKQIEILNKIEEILKNSLKKESFSWASDLNQKTSSESKSNATTMNSENTREEENQEAKVSPFKQILNLIVSFFMSVVKAPFQLIHVYIKNEILNVIRRELKLYFVLIALLGVLFIIFIVFWILISLAVGFYFQELGFSNYESILLSIAFQISIFLIVTFIFVRVSKKVKSIRMIRKTLDA